ncbi:MAG: hypothetical protein ACI9S8_001246 [Chlamydiales bacterium]|jgi:hypothetical protein
MTTNISDSQLLEFNKQGFIPGPNEQSYHFLSRVKDSLHFANNIDEYLESSEELFPFRAEDKIPTQEKESAFHICKTLFDMAPSWVPAFYNNHDLSVWHGGSSWIPEVNEGSPIIFFQLRKAFKASSTYLWIYQRNEILSHEAVHVGRMAFHEPEFEEILAYRTSSSPLRRLLGPIIQSPEETMAFALIISFIVALDYFLLFTQNFSLYATAMWLKLIPLFLILYGLWRIWKLHRVFEKCLENLEALLSSKDKANAVIYRLTDKEIYRFSEDLSPTILQYAHENKSRSLRWRLLNIAYF